MKYIKSKFGLAIIGLVTLTIGTIFAFGFGHGHDGKGRGFGPGVGQVGFPPAFLVDRIANELGLSDEQKAQSKQILEDSKARIKPLMEQMKSGHEQAIDLGTDGNFDEAKVNQLANSQAETMKQLFIEKEKTKAQLFAIMTPEQREKAKEMQAKFADRMKGRFDKHDKKSAPTEE